MTQTGRHRPLLGASPDSSAAPSSTVRSSAAAAGRQADHGGFRPDIQGLRALAVLAVVAYHAAVPLVGGGYTGVDMFFVISGFLITGLLWRDIETTGRVQFARFYARRARRILPAAGLVLAVTVLTAAVVQPPLVARATSVDGIVAALFAINYRLAIQGSNYLTAGASPSPLQHYWSLAVEEQFYVIWPALIALAAIVAAIVHRRRAEPATGSAPLPARGTIALLLAGVGAASFGWSLYLSHQSPPWAFYSLPTRAWELALGGLLALATPALARIPRPLAAAIGWAGLAGAVGGVFVIGPHSAYPGTAALVPTLGIAAVLAAGCGVAGRGSLHRRLSPREGPAALLSRAPLQRIGDVSYSWYLWHWPPLVLLPVALGHPLDLPARLATVVAAGALAGLTLMLVENPIRFAAPLRRHPGRSLVLGAGLVGSATALSVVAGLLVPSTTGHGIAATPQLAGAGKPSAAHSAAPATPPTPAAALAATEAPLTASIQQALQRSLTTQNVPANLQPTLSQAASNKAPPLVDGCMLSWLPVYQPTCAYTQGSPTVVLMGDSHAAQWEPPLQQIAQTNGWRLQVWAKATCPPNNMPIFSPYLGRPYTECEQWRTDMLARIAAEHPALVVLGVARHYDSAYGFLPYDAQWLAGLQRTVSAIRAGGSQVLMIGPIPKPPFDVPTCLSAHLTNLPACNLNRAATLSASGTAAEKAVVTAAGGSYLDVSPWFCTATSCPVVVGNLMVFHDDNHLTTYYPSWLTPALAPVLQQAVAGTIAGVGVG